MRSQSGFSLLAVSSTAAALAVRNHEAVPQPSVASNISYWGSACPENGLTTSFGPLNANSSSYPLTFELSSFAPNIGSFNYALRMCDIVSTITIDPGYKFTINAHGTSAKGGADLPGNATMRLRSTYAFAESYDKQSVNTLSVPGPLSGQFAQRLPSDEGDVGVTSPCGGGELDMEFVAIAVQDLATNSLIRTAVNSTSWSLVTDVEVVKC